jgi:hypothetical protein
VVAGRPAFGRAATGVAIAVLAARRPRSTNGGSFFAASLALLTPFSIVICPSFLGGEGTPEKFR